MLRFIQNLDMDKNYITHTTWQPCLRICHFVNMPSTESVNQQQLNVPQKKQLRFSSLTHLTPNSLQWRYSLDTKRQKIGAARLKARTQFVFLLIVVSNLKWLRGWLSRCWLINIMEKEHLLYMRQGCIFIFNQTQQKMFSKFLLLFYWFDTYRSKTRTRPVV